MGNIQVTDTDSNIDLSKLTEEWMDRGEKMVRYDRLWETMQKKNITQYRLIKYYGVSAGQIGRLKKNMYVSTHTIEMMCAILGCSVEEVMEVVHETPEEVETIHKALEEAETIHKAPEEAETIYKAPEETDRHDASPKSQDPPAT